MPTSRTHRSPIASAARACLAVVLTCPFVHLGCILDPSPLGELPGDTDGADTISVDTLVVTSQHVDDTTLDPLPTTTAGPDTTGDPPDGTTGEPVTTGEDPPPETGCIDGGACEQLDVLFVIDNSGTMGEEQSQLADSFPAFVKLLRGLSDANGQLVGADVHIMVTTTDVPHPLCTPFEKPDYDAADGQPIDTPCTDRLARFTGLGADPPVMSEICTSRCAEAAPSVPTDPFIRFSPTSHNVIDPDGMGDPAADALACIGPQGIDGCGMESPLEAMRRALDLEARWNIGERPFLRPGAPLAVVIVTDETDCSTLNFAYFDPKLHDDPEFSKYWPSHPSSGQRTEPTSAVCWNAGMTCADDDDDGEYEWCMSEDKHVLQPVSRYTEALADLRQHHGKDVVMLVLGGVPQVTEHNHAPPFEPLAGGVDALVYRDWQPDDILPGDTDTPADKQFEFGIGPGCVGPAGQAVPPGRIQEVCQALDIPDDPDTAVNERAMRCCIESVCDSDYTAALGCLAGMLQPTLHAMP
ncbi:hypothetical protein OV079_05565 [Nannocystis pusilla]|uniref:Uncharacterized protein n=1 Tax=Nannocystis pusilla TaxID=889268 RepID=A0A9X3EJW9_9BACT|nr:hypothetical protein [Nannocystis pusilla]MCY1005045.1 hypothetical protein [Nannocystis pusilla]